MNLRPFLFFRLLLVALLYSAFSLVLYAQTPHYSLRGKIIDESHEPLPAANVALRTPTGKKLYKGAITGSDGSFSISSVASGEYILEVTYVGYTPYSTKLRVSGHKTLSEVVLSPASEMLDAVVVTGKGAEVSVRGDTLVFNAASYKTPQGAMLQDLIKRLPGAELNDDGSISINGEKISKIMVDGKEFFGSDPQMATKNLPAEMVERLEVLNKQSEQSRLTGFDDGEEEVVLNLATKLANKKGIFGNALAGYGYKDRYELNGVFNKFSTKGQWTLLAGSNNTNGIGLEDLDTDSNANSGRRGGGGGGRWFRGGLFSGDNLPRGGINTSAHVGFNGTYVPNSVWELTGNGRYNYELGELEATSFTENLLPNEASTFTSETLSNRQHTHRGGGDAMIHFTPSNKTEIVFIPMIYSRTRRALFGSEYHTSSADSIAVNHGSLNSDKLQVVTNAANRIILSQKLNDRGSTLSSQLELNYRRSGDTYATQSMLFTEQDQRTETQNQEQKNLSNYFYYRLVMTYVEPLGKGFFVQGMTQWSQAYTHTDRATTYLDKTLGQEDRQQNLYNILNTFKAGVHFKYKNKQTDVTLGINVAPTYMHSKQSVNTSFIEGRMNEFFVAPMLRVTYTPNKQTSWRMRYWSFAQTPRAEQMFVLPDVSNALVTVIGNPNLRPTYTHGMGMNFRTFFPSSKRSLSVRLFGMLRQNDVVNRTATDTETGKQTLTYINTPFTFSSALNGTFSTPLFHRALTLSLSGGGNYNRMVSMINDNPNITHNVFYRGMLALSFTHDWLYMRGFGELNNQWVQNSLSQRSSTNTPEWRTGGEVAVTLPAGWRIDSEAEYRTRGGYAAGYRDAAVRWNASVAYSFLKNKAATIRLSAYDLLNQNQNIQRQVSSVAISDTRVNSLGRLVMLHFIYRFNLFAGSATKEDMQPLGRRNSF